MDEELAAEIQTAQTERERHRQLLAEHREAHQETWNILHTLRHHLGRLNCFSHHPPVPDPETAAPRRR